MIDRSGWKKVKLGDLVHYVKDKVDADECGLEYYLGGEHFSTSDLHVNGRGTIAGSTIGPAFHMRFKPGQVLLVSRNPHLRKSSVAEFEGICSNVTYVCETKSDDLLQTFLPFVMSSDSFWAFAEANKRGSTNFYLNWSDFSQYEFLLPPIDEQKRIAELLWAADDVIQKHDSMLDALAEIKSFQMNELANIITSSHEQYLLGDLITYESGQVDPKEQPYRDMPLIAPNHIENGTGKVLEVVSAAAQNAISGKYRFAKGQVVYSKIRPNLNKVFIADFDGLCSADMYPLSAKDGILTKYLYYVLTSKPFLEYATVCSIRTSIPKLNRTDMSNFRISCPDVSSQKEFIDKMQQVDTSIENCRTHISSAQTLLNTLTNYYLGGAN